MLSGQVGLRRLLERYLEEKNSGQYSHENFFDAAVRLLELDVRYDKAMLSRIPKSGPVLLIANHPYGVIDGIVLAWLTLKMRPDAKILAIDFLTRAPEVAPYCLPIDLTRSKNAGAVTVASRGLAVSRLKEGGAIALFPAGGVGVARYPFRSPALDLPWIRFTARLASISGVRIVPVFFRGQNSWKYQASSRFSALLRASLICHETSRKIGKEVDVVIGDPIEGSSLSHIADRKSLVEELRRRTFALAGRPDVNWMRDAPLPPDMR